MNLRTYTSLSAILAFAAGGTLMVPMSATAQQAGVEELTRGPVHEAFAESTSYDPQPGILAKQQPPAMIEEIPPSQQLEGDNVAWIPGYWGWEDETNDFIWISGIWRNLPPGRQWVPGYWAQAEDQWQWTSGYWSDQAEQEVAYLPEPPKSLENGPSVEAPSSNNIWITGNWRYRQDRYAWQPGYWEPAQQNWIHQPGHYQWTRRGYVYVDGYWDYNLARRGVLFAPVRFERAIYSQPGYSYTPTMVIAASAFLNHLFVRPSYGHYYFGDYYEPRYQGAGYVTLFNYQTDRHGYDPIYAQRRWEHRNEQGWERARRDDYDYYRDNAAARPARTWGAMSALAVGSRHGERDKSDFAVPLNAYVKNPGAKQAFEVIGKKQQTKLVEQREAVRKFGQDRQQLESRAAVKPADGPDKSPPIIREKFAKSPIVAKRVEQLSSKNAPPKLREPKITPPAPIGNKPREDQVPMPKKPVPDRGPKVAPGVDPKGKDTLRPDLKPDITPKKPDVAPARPAVEPRKPQQKDAPPQPDVKKVTPPEHQRPQPKQPEKVTPPERQPQVPKQPKVDPQPPRQVEPRQAPKVQPQPTPRPQPAPQREPAPQQKQPQVTPPPRPQPAPQREAAPQQKQPQAPQQKGRQTQDPKDGKNERP